MPANTKPAPIRERIIDALEQSGGSCQYHRLLRLVFPERHFPRAFERPNRGGPPGCSMALSRAITKYGFSLKFHPDRRSGVVHATVRMGSARRDV